jgi:hypothetical protein
MTAGPDVIRGMAPNQTDALASARHLTGSAKPRVRPDRHHVAIALTTPSAAANAGEDLVEPQAATAWATEAAR